MANMFSGEQKSERVKSIVDVKEADLIAFPRYTRGTPKTILYWHFAIVEDIDPINDKLTIIHFTAGYGGATDLAAKSQATIAREDITFADEEVYVVRLHPAQCLEPREVLGQARSKIGEAGYNLVFNNCEHFGIWCKTGHTYSKQVVDAGKAIIAYITKLLQK